MGLGVAVLRRGRTNYRILVLKIIEFADWMIQGKELNLAVLNYNELILH